MAKEIKFNVKLLVDGKEQLVTATGNVRTMPREVSSLQEACERFNHVGFAMSNISSAIGSIAGTLNSLTSESRAFSGAMAAANTMTGKGAVNQQRTQI